MTVLDKKEKSCWNCIWKQNECYGEEVCDDYKSAEDDFEQKQPLNQDGKNAERVYSLSA